MIKNIIAIYPGRFQPFGKHHAAAFKWLQQQFSHANAFIVTSDKVDPPKSPFNFSEKKDIISQYGFDNVVQVKNPYKAEELMGNFNPEDTAVVFMVGEKDMKEDPRFKIGQKKDGSPSYFQSYKDNKGNLQGFDKHGYLVTAPHVSIAIPGYGEMSGTELRNVLGTKTVSRDEKKKVFKDIFGWYDENTANMIFDKLEPLTESVFTKKWWKHVFESIDNKNTLTEENIFDKLKTKAKDIVKKVKQENSETKAAFVKLLKAAKGELKLSDSDKTEIGDQMKDVLKMLGLATIAIAPGGSIAAVLIKLFKQEHLITPSAFVNEIGDTSAPKYKWKEVDREGYFTYISFITDSGTEYNVDLQNTTYTPKDSTSSIRAIIVEFAATIKDAGGYSYSTANVVVNKGEMYKVMATVADILKVYIKKSKAEAIIYSPSKKQGEESTSQRDILYKAFIKKAYPEVKFEQKGQLWVVALLSGAKVNENLNEVGEASASKYKWEEISKSDYFVRAQFITDSDTEYAVYLETLSYTPKNSTSSVLALNTEFSAKTKGSEGSSHIIITNKGEMYKVMATITDIIKKYIKTFKAQAIIYSPSKKQGETFGAQRDKLYKAFISKAMPDAQFEQKGDMIVAVLPGAKVNENLNEVGEGNAKTYPFKSDTDPSKLIKLAKEFHKTNTSNSYYETKLVYKFKTDKADYIVTFAVSMERQKYVNFTGDPNFKPGPPYKTYAEVGFNIEGDTEERDTNLNEQFSVLSTVTKIIFDFIDKLNKTGGNLMILYIGAKSDTDLTTKLDSKRGKLYAAYLKKNLAKLPGYDAREHTNSDGNEFIEIHKKATVNEVGEASASKYKWEEIDREGYFVYIGFETESDTTYFVDLGSTTFNGIPVLNIEFSAKPKGWDGASVNIISNKGEMYKVMATITDIIKTYLKKSKKVKGIIYYPSKKGTEKFGNQRDKLYKAFITKAIPGIKFLDATSRYNPNDQGVVALLPGAKVNEGYMGAEQTKKHNAKLAKLKQFLDANIGREFVYDFDMYPKTVVGVGIQEGIIKEGKQVGPLYHYTSADGLKGILNSNRINASEEYYLGNDLYYISFTRNKNFHNKKSKFGVKTEYRITLDGDKLSNRYKITPFAYKPGWNYEDNWEYDWLENEPESVVRDFFNNTGDYDEQEERISLKGPEGGIDNIKNYILAVDKVENLQEGVTFIPSSLGKKLISDGGAAGHMAHPFNVDWVKNGKDLLEVFKMAVEYLKNGPGAVKIDGLNASIRLIELDGKKQFVLDRGSQKDLDVRGITKADLLDRFGEGHGMIQVGGKVLDIFNASLNATSTELKQLGLWNDPNLMFNLEYVSGTSNVIEYGNNFLAIHGLLEITRQTNAKTGKPGARVTTEVPYNETVMQNYIDKLAVFAQKEGYEVVGSVPTEMKSEPNFTKVLGEKITVNYGNGKQETKPMSQWLSIIKVPENETVKLKDGKTVNALSKAVLNAVIEGVPLNEFVADVKDIPLVIDGAITYLATAKLGDEVLKNLDSKLGSVSDHEGVVIRDERIYDKPFKLTGQFIITGQTSQFQTKQ